MDRAEEIEIIRSLESEAVDRYLDWAGGHTNKYISVRPYEPDVDPSQQLEVVHIPAEPDLGIANTFGSMAMGTAAYRDMIDQFVSSGMLKVARTKIENNQNLLVITPHLEYIWDTALTHNGLFVDSGDADFAKRNVIIVNQMLKFLRMGEMAVIDILKASGDVVIGEEVEGAKTHKVPEALTRSTNRLMAPIIGEMLTKKGVVLHRALTGTRANKTPNGLVIPRVDPKRVNGIKRRSPDVFSVAIQVEPGEAGQAKVLPMSHVESEADIHDLMTELAEASEELVGSPVTYEGSLGAEAA